MIRESSGDVFLYCWVDKADQLLMVVGDQGEGRGSLELVAVLLKQVLPREVNEDTTIDELELVA